MRINQLFMGEVSGLGAELGAEDCAASLAAPAHENTRTRTAKTISIMRFMRGSYNAAAAVAMQNPPHALPAPLFPAQRFTLTYSDIGMYCSLMARAATTSDAFNAVAEPRRREILTFLAGSERQVGEIVMAIGLDQPSVSKHLGVLRRVGLVNARRNGRHRLYRTNAEAIKPMHEWTQTFERYWRHQLIRVKERAEAEMKRDLKPE
jgi:DNA-binding transcriptional ArsR family regulator